MTLLQDVKFSLRTIAKNPGFVLVVVITLALGIGINNTVFTLTNAVLLKSLAFEEPDQIMHISNADPTHGRQRMSMSYLDFTDYRNSNQSFQAMAAYQNVAVDLSDDTGAGERVNGLYVTANLFALLGQKTLRGRDFTAGEDAAGATPVAIIGYNLWQNRYGSDEKVLGKAIKVTGKPYTIVGIMPRGMQFASNQDMWLPLVPAPELKRDSRGYEALGRLKPGKSVQNAQVEMKSIAQRLQQSYPETNKGIETTVMSLHERFQGPQIRTLFFTMQTAVGFVLLIACANVANLLLSRAVRRTRETSIRTALGASRWRVIRQLLVESVMLSFMGGVIGFLLSILGVRMFKYAIADTGAPYWLDFTMDYHVTLFFIGTCFVTGILFGIAPALQLSRLNINENLREGGRGSSGGMRSRRLATVLLIGEIGLTIVLLVGAGLMMRSFLRAQYFDLGIRTENLLTARIAVRSKYTKPEEYVAFTDRLMARLGKIQGIEGLTLATSIPASGGGGRTLKLEDKNLADANNKFPSVSTISIGPGYFQALQLNAVRGREFLEGDGAPGGEVVMVDQSFINKYWPGQDAIGKRIHLGDKDDGPWSTVVGISPHVLQTGSNSPEDMAAPVVYVPYRQDPNQGFNVLVRSRTAKAPLVAELRSALREVDPDIPIFSIITMDEAIAQRSWPWRVFGSLFLTFAVIALVMSSVGIYALTAYGVHQRTNEIGVRLALGASQKSVLWLVLRQGLTRIAVGLVMGLAAAFGLSRVLASLLFQVTPTDPVTFVSISLLLIATTITACVVPAWRAMGLDPAIALRRE